MKAIQVQVPGGPDSLLLVDLPDPLPGPGQVRVKAHAIRVGRPDVLIRQGTYKWMPPLPAVPGAELAGVVDAIGEGVTQWQLGDRVLVSARELAQRGGCYAEAIHVGAGLRPTEACVAYWRDRVAIRSMAQARRRVRNGQPKSREA